MYEIRLRYVPAIQMEDPLTAWLDQAAHFHFYYYAPLVEAVQFLWIIELSYALLVPAYTSKSYTKIMSSHIAEKTTIIIACNNYLRQK